VLIGACRALNSRPDSGWDVRTDRVFILGVDSTDSSLDGEWVKYVVALDSEGDSLFISSESCLERPRHILPELTPDSAYSLKLRYAHPSETGLARVTDKGILMDYDQEGNPVHFQDPFVQYFNGIPFKTVDTKCQDHL